jgi:hypothetical protein
MKKTVPKYLVELYGATQAQWERWLAFVEQAKAVLVSRESAQAWFSSLPVKGTGVRCGLHSSSSSITAFAFPWADVDRTSSDYFGVTISLWFETADCDIKTVASFSWD